MPSDIHDCLPPEALELLNLSDSLLDLLAAMASSNGVHAEPLPDEHKVMLAFDNKRVELTDALLLEKLGLAEKVVTDRVLRCPHCDYLWLDIKLQCPYCGSTNIEKVKMMQHIICGYIDLEYAFRRGEQLVCPHCSVNLTSENDYKILGTLYYCHSCHMRFHEPKVILKCRRCGKDFKPTDALYKPVHTLNLTERGKSIIENAIDIRIAIYRALIEANVEFKCNTKLTGATGLEHQVDFIVPRSMLAIDVVPKLVNDSEALLLLLKARDLTTAGMIKKYVIVSRLISESISSLLQRTPAIILIPEQLPSRIKERIHDIVSV
ncbi:hypothetical protein [Pyrolobus fumarii]|uniref:TackOD1 domain-containing metal-binding protein n=1 Tax=Pyrolobus fumarii TaxID=54252 RepID=UPI00064F06A4|nr:hypothetical protein [Pyrolobus fumarii]